MSRPKVQFTITVKNNFLPAKGVKYSTSTASLFKPAYSTGQIIFVEDAGQIYLDFHNYRRCYNATDEAPSNGLNYLGISTTDPSTGTVTIDGTIITPNENDMVAYETKEFIYRKGGENGDILGWYEIGDESNTEWKVVTN